MPAAEVYARNLSDSADAAIRFVISALAVGLMPVIILAWAFELTPDGFGKEQD